MDLHKREHRRQRARPAVADRFSDQPGVAALAPCSALVRRFGRSDEYHLQKHWSSAGRTSAASTPADLGERRPWWIRMHRIFIAAPVQQGAPRLLVALGVRTGKGRVESELSPKELRPVAQVAPMAASR